MLIAFSIAPSHADADGGVSEAVARCVRIIRDSGIRHQTDSMFTTLEGDWDECLGVIKACVDELAKDSARISLVMKADIRPGRSGEMVAKLQRLEAAVARQADSP